MPPPPRAWTARFDTRTATRRRISARRQPCGASSACFRAWRRRPRRPDAETRRARVAPDMEGDPDISRLSHQLRLCKPHSWCPVSALLQPKPPKRCSARRVVEPRVAAGQERVDRRAEWRNDLPKL